MRDDSFLTALDRALSNRKAATSSIEAMGRSPLMKDSTGRLTPLGEEFTNRLINDKSLSDADIARIMDTHPLTITRRRALANAHTNK